MNIIAKKSWGQNFLIDENIINIIVDVINIKDKAILEVGPGTGNLTRALLEKKPKKFFAIEKDKNLATLLQAEFNNEINIINEDILALEDKPMNTKKLGIRPENIKVNTGHYEGKIRTIESLGAETVISIDYKQIELLALFQGIFKGIKGENINFDINTNNILYFNDKNESIWWVQNS